MLNCHKKQKRATSLGRELERSKKVKNKKIKQNNQERIKTILKAVDKSPILMHYQLWYYFQFKLCILPEGKSTIFYFKTFSKLLC